MYGEKAWRQLHKNAVSCIELVLEAASHKAAAVWTSTTHLENYPRHARHCWRSKDGFISNLLQWSPSHGWAKVRRPARTYLQQLCTDTGCRMEDLPRVMDDRDKWQERIREIHASNMPWWWYIYIYIYIYTYTHTHTINAQFLQSSNVHAKVTSFLQYTHPLMMAQD